MRWREEKAIDDRMNRAGNRKLGVRRFERKAERDEHDAAAEKTQCKNERN